MRPRRHVFLLLLLCCWAPLLQAHEVRPGYLEITESSAGDLPTALLLFNAGIEIGQLTFVALLLLTAKALRRITPNLVGRLSWAPPYAIGSLASFWLIERIQFIF